MDWNALMDDLKKHYKLETDAELARMIGATPNDVWQSRARGKKLPAYSRWQLLDKAGFVKTRSAIFTALEAILPASVVVEIVESHNKVVRQNTLSSIEKDKSNAQQQLNEIAEVFVQQDLTEDEFLAAALKAYNIASLSK